MDKLQKKQAGLRRRHRRVRGKISGTAARPRLCVTRSNSNIYAQVIDDVAGRTPVSYTHLDAWLGGVEVPSLPRSPFGNRLATEDRGGPWCAERRASRSLEAGRNR